MTTNDSAQVLIMAGGTGGHVFPALAAADEFQQRGYRVAWLGTRRGIESRLVPAANIPIHYINVAGLRGKGLVNLLKAPLQLLSALWQALKVVRELQPVCVLGMGGFVSGPGAVAAWMLRRPLVIHEQNAVAGTTNRLSAIFARRVLQGYPISLGGDKARYIGNPVRSGIARIPAPEQRWAGRSGALRLLVLGGSLGAQAINEVIPEALASMPEQQRPEVWHQCGPKHLNKVQLDYQQKIVPARVEAFIDDMAMAYSWADLVVCRAGALTVAELTAAGLGAVLVPLPNAIDDHQTENARWLVDNDAGDMLLQKDMSSERVVKILNSFAADRPRLLAMAESSRGLAKTDAAQQVVENCLEVAHG